jgi:hypothetical protein
MKLSTAQTLGIVPMSTRDVEVNPVTLITDRHFSKQGGRNYRKDTVDELVQRRISFSSDFNIVEATIIPIITVNCPVCKKKLKYDGGSGSGDSFGYRFKCNAKCGTAVTLTIPSEGVHYELKNAKLDKLEDDE